MGIKFTREYNDILSELAEGVYMIEEFYNFFEMSKDDWSLMPENEQKLLAQTLSDDLFYGLESEPEILLGKGTIVYNKMMSNINIYNDKKLIKTISLHIL